MIKGIIKVILVIFIVFSFSACEDKSSNSQAEKKEEQVKFTPKLKMPEWDKDGGKKIWDEYKNWHDAKNDPIPAMKIGYAYSEKLHDYEKALEWYKYADSMIPLGENSYFACYALQQLKKYDEAISWCQKAIDLKWNEALYQLGTVYYKKNDFDNALKWFTKAYEKGEKIAVTSIGLSNTKLGNILEAEKWYKKGVEESNVDSYHNIGRFYFHTMKDNLKASAYSIALIDTKYTKKSVLRVLQDEWKIPNDIIQKGYELQLSSDEFPIKFKGDLGL
ncbi:tetratricopeptide repeat protein [Arcobacter defluvii]|uniref:Tetratricopeptide repeat protein n=1 Tax=Arcobacter defluvii TaxID=873191 RepID=A0AAE7BEJ3_9BACT|nr:tetratricopeptide repeat protein [Arcobacter defluvii]QKF78025.1 tetratricopeptide repeat protein [Arcobacter defluvii]